MLALTVAACSSGPPPLQPPARSLSAAAPARTSLDGAIVGFSVDTPARAAIAAREGISVTILYGSAPPRGSALARALVARGIKTIDAGISSELFYWECHRTHTVAPPPKSYPYNSYCETDENPRVRSEAIVLHDVAKMLARDARYPYVIGYWVLDDWPGWDAGSARGLLQKIHAEIATATPGYPAVCGFGAGLGKPGVVNWDPGTAANYSNGGCDEVGWYVYTPFGLRKPSSGNQYDWSMRALLPAMTRSLARYGWSAARAPLMGIGQAWGGAYGRGYFQPGLSRAQIRTQAGAFCAYGANAISWYAWDDSGFVRATQTPLNSRAIAAGIADGIAACHFATGNPRSSSGAPSTKRVTSL